MNVYRDPARAGDRDRPLPGWKDALARERAPVRLATTAGAVAAAWAFGALFLDAGGWRAVAALAAPAAAIAVWLSVAGAREPAPPREALLRCLLAVVHPLSVLAIALGAAIAAGTGRGAGDLIWSVAVILAVHALARRHRARLEPCETAPGLRRVTALGIALLALGHVLLHLPHLLSNLWDGAPLWWGMDTGLDGSALALAIAVAAVSGASLSASARPGTVPIAWLCSLAALWTWTAGWTAATATGLVLPALALSAAVLLSPLLAPRPAPGERLETGSVAFGLYALAAAWAAALVAPGSIPEAIGAPASGEAALRYGLLALFAYQARDLILWGVMTRLAPGEHWTAALWIVWMAVSWVIGPEGLRALGGGWVAASLVGLPWGALGEADGTGRMPATIAAAALLTAVLAAGAYILLARRDRRR